MTSCKSFCWFWFVLLAFFCRPRHLVAQQQRPPDVTDPEQAPNILYYNTRNTSGNDVLQQNFDTVFEFLSRVTPPNGFATCLGYGGFIDTVYAHTACYNMSDQNSCSSCVRRAYLQLREYRPIGARLWTNTSSARCNLRYESENFTNSLPPGTLGVLGPNASSPSPPPPPPAAQVPPTPASPPPDGGSGSSNTGVIVGVVSGSVAILIIGTFLFFCIRRRRSQRQNLSRAPDPLDELEGTGGPISFSYRELSTATDNFREQNKVGQGGFGPVYKAVLENGTPLAVKKLSVGSHQGKREFVNEINIITGVRHRNLVKLVGYCVESDHRILVYEFLDRKSLDRVLFGNSEILSWQDRFQIIVGVAKGLAYLHEESHIQIIHRDIKAGNILLDKTLQPKISDFGISKLAGVDETGTTRVAGTFGYMAPEYALRGRLSTKADVFSFGILVLEIISGRKCVDDDVVLLHRAWNLVCAGKVEELVDPRLEKSYILEEVSRAANIALHCTRDLEESRPKMSAVVAMLMGYLGLEPVPAVEPPSYFRQQDFSSAGTTTSSSSEWTGTAMNPR